ncbi:hypothetical protein JYT18_00660 [Desulfocapsa sp. AH-315-J15]|nr:hypothetical protein [bacterium AH-315-N22]MBN4052832.1 hypothetical protein [bacterium AH-315-K15]MBN4058720.1 hypothetical protein [Desulfocapsa sp. AH-315-J15]
MDEKVLMRSHFSTGSTHGWLLTQDRYVSLENRVKRSEQDGFDNDIKPGPGWRLPLDENLDLGQVSGKVCSCPEKNRQKHDLQEIVIVFHLHL